MVLWALVMALVLALVITAGAWPTTVRRRRQHVALVRDSVIRMREQSAAQPSRLWRLRRAVVDVLCRQEHGAAMLDRAPCSADLDRLVAVAEDMDLLLAADAETTPSAWGYGRQLLDDSWREEPGQVPTLAGHAELADLCTRAWRVTEGRITRARLIVAESARLGQPEQPDCHGQLHAAFDRGAEEMATARELAASGDVLGALRVMTNIELPVPDDGVPGQADVPELRAQTNALAKLALRHRAEIAAARERRAQQPMTRSEE